MSIDYLIPVEGNIDFEPFLARLAQQMQFKLEEINDRVLRLSEANEMLSLYAKRGMTEQEADHYRFEELIVDYLPKSYFSIRLKKFCGTEPNAFMARAIRVILDSTPLAVTILVNGESLLLQRRSGEKRATIYNPKFWSEECVQLLIAESHH